MIQPIQSESDFQVAISGDKFAVVEFYTTWCPDCRRVAKFLDDVTAKHADKQFYSMNSEEYPEISDKYEVKGAPSFLIFKNGEKVAHLHSRWAKKQPEIETFLDNMESKTR